MFKENIKKLFILTAPSRLVRFVLSRKKNEKEYSVPYTPPKKSYENLICLTGFGHSGSGALLDYLAEFEDTTVFGYHDVQYSGKPRKKNEKVFEIDLFRLPCCVFDIEKVLNKGNHLLENQVIKMFIHFAQYFYLQGEIYTDEFWRLTQKFIDDIIDFKIESKNGSSISMFNGFTALNRPNYKNVKSPMMSNTKEGKTIYYLKKMSIQEYRKIANEYITSFLKTIESKKNLVLDQVLTTSMPEIHTKIEFLESGGAKPMCIAVFRDPRDVYVTGFLLNEGWIPKNPVDFVKWYHHRGTPAWFEENHPNYKIVRFEDLVLNYDKTTDEINDFLGLDKNNHIKKKKYFNPIVSVKNIGIHKNFNDQKAIEYIKNNLKQYCWEE